MDSRTSSQPRTDRNPKNTRLRVNLNFQNPLIAVKSTKFKLPQNMAESNDNNNEPRTTQNGSVALKKVQFNVDLEQNYSSLKQSLNGKNSEVKKEEIFGPTGTVRGFKNIIKERQVNFDRLNGEIEEENEESGIVFYSTTMGGIRSTVGDCRVVRSIFENHRLKVDERDIFMEKKYQSELDSRLKIDGAQVPQVFVNGFWLGGKKEIMELNETGRLITLLSEFERHNGKVCSTCGGFNFINCTACKGSKASRKLRIGMREMSVLKCTICNENGLVRCPTCSVQTRTQNGVQEPSSPTS